MKDFLKTSDLSRADLKYLLARSAKFKAKPHARRTALAGETVCLYFNKPSTRTRISFETAVARLGGTPVTLGPSDVQLGRGETIEDTARVASRFSRAFVIRTFKDEDVERLAAAATIPVINALTDGHHPCQSIADLLTLAEQRGPLDRCKIAYVGDGNNVAVSLMQAAALAGTDFAIAAPPGYQIPEQLVEEARAVAKKSGSEVLQTVDPAAEWQSGGSRRPEVTVYSLVLNVRRADGGLDGFGSAVLGYCRFAELAGCAREIVGAIDEEIAKRGLR